MLDEATVSADLLREDDASAWDFLLEQIHTKWPDATRDAVAETINYAFIFNTNGKVPTDLPVFSKIDLKKALRSIKKLQMKTALGALPIGLKD